MARKPRYVRSRETRAGLKHQSWVPTGETGGKRWLDWCDTYEEALTQRLAYLRLQTELPRGHTLQELYDLCEADLREDNSAGHLDWFRMQRKALEKQIPENLLVSALTSGLIQQCVRRRSREVSGSTIRHHLRALSMVLHQALEKGWIRTNPLKQVKLPRVEEGRRDVFQQQELEQILEFMAGSQARTRDRDADIVRFLYFTGLRRGEFCRLRVEDLRLARRTIRLVGKTGTFREWQISPQARDAIQRIAAERTEGPVVSGNPVNVVSLMFRRWHDRLREIIDFGGRRFSAHALRHSFITHLVENLVPLPLVKHLARHKSLEMTLRYFHIRDGDLEAALEKLTLD